MHSHISISYFGRVLKWRKMKANRIIWDLGVFFIINDAMCWIFMYSAVHPTWRHWRARPARSSQQCLMKNTRQINSMLRTQYFSCVYLMVSPPLGCTCSISQHGQGSNLTNDYKDEDWHGCNFDLCLERSGCTQFNLNQRL